MEATKYILENKEKGTEIVIVYPSGVIAPSEYVIFNLGQLIIDCANNINRNCSSHSSLFFVICCRSYDLCRSRRINPRITNGEHSNIGTIGVAIGLVVMMILDVALG